jgi:hypothetical protein
MILTTRVLAGLWALSHAITAATTAPFSRKRALPPTTFVHLGSSRRSSLSSHERLELLIAFRGGADSETVKSPSKKKKKTKKRTLVADVKAEPLQKKKPKPDVLDVKDATSAKALQKKKTKKRKPSADASDVKDATPAKAEPLQKKKPKKLKPDASHVKDCPVTPASKVEPLQKKKAKKLKPDVSDVKDFPATPAKVEPLQKKKPKVSKAAREHVANDIKSTSPNYRIQRELKEFLRDPPPGLSVQVGKNLRVWIVTIEGPGIYKDEQFRLRIAFPNTYPMVPPSVYFLPPHLPV